MEEVTGLMAVILFLGCPVLVTIAIGWIRTNDIKAKQAERERARATYERIVTEKLDVIKTAIAMGMEQDGLRELDERLERLIGSYQLRNLLDDEKPVTPPVNPELRDNDLLDEMDRQREQRRGRGRE